MDLVIIVTILVGGFKHFLLILSIIYGMSSFPLTFIFFKMVKTTNQYIYIYYFIYYIYIILYIIYILYYILYIYIYYIIYIYEPPQKPGNTKYVLDGHWFMEIDGNC